MTPNSGSEPTARSTPTVLIVCTANRCRSPLAAALLRQYLAVLPDGAAVTVASAGLLRGGETVPDRGRDVARGAGLDLSTHISTLITPAMIARADLVLTAARTQARDVVAMEPTAWPRVFTLLQAERWWVSHPRPSHVALREWVETVGAGRQRREIIGANQDDDIRDPFRRSRRVWRSVFTQSDRATHAIARGIVGLDVSA